MRRLLSALRSDERGDPPTAPQPGLGDLPALVDGLRRVGVPVTLTVDGTTAGVPATVGLCAYRVVQESLSNAGRHATGAAVTVHIGREADRLRVQVANDGPFARPPDVPAGGHGLDGMRERVALVGGSLTAGPGPDGGFVVEALFPLRLESVP